jgi:tetratricopeptide (TPR) repeat protein
MSLPLQQTIRLFGKYDEAIDLVDKALSLAPRPIYYAHLSNYYMLANQGDKAIPAAQKSEDPFWRIIA